VSFDLIQVEQSFPRVKAVQPQEDKTFHDALIKRNQDLTPAASELTHLLSLVTRVQTILDNLILTPGDFDSCQLDEIKQVGDFANGTLLKSSRLDADICVVLKTLPTREAVSSLGGKVFEELKKVASSPAESETFKLCMNDRGFEIVSTATVAMNISVGVQVFVTTQQQNIRKLEANLHLDYKTCQQSLNSIKHTKWFEDTAQPHPTIKVIVRLLKDLQSRFEGLQPLSPWMLQLLAWYCTMNNPKREALPLPVAFKRVFQLIAAGFFFARKCRDY
jgi:interleukin enhancer-binding factor 2